MSSPSWSSLVSNARQVSGKSPGGKKESSAFSGQVGSALETEKKAPEVKEKDTRDKNKSRLYVTVAMTHISRKGAAEIDKFLDAFVQFASCVCDPAPGTETSKEMTHQEGVPYMNHLRNLMGRHGLSNFFSAAQASGFTGKYVSTGSMNPPQRILRLARTMVSFLNHNEPLKDKVDGFMAKLDSVMVSRSNPDDQNQVLTRPIGEIVRDDQQRHEAKLTEVDDMDRSQNVLAGGYETTVEVVPMDRSLAAGDLDSLLGEMVKVPDTELLTYADTLLDVATDNIVDSIAEMEKLLEKVHLPYADGALAVPGDDFQLRIAALDSRADVMIELVQSFALIKALPTDKQHKEIEILVTEIRECASSASIKADMDAVRAEVETRIMSPEFVEAQFVNADKLVTDLSDAFIAKGLRLAGRQAKHDEDEVTNLSKALLDLQPKVNQVKANLAELRASYKQTVEAGFKGQELKLDFFEDLLLTIHETGFGEGVAEIFSEASRLTDAIAAAVV